VLDCMLVKRIALVLTKHAKKHRQRMNYVSPILKDGFIMNRQINANKLHTLVVGFMDLRLKLNVKNANATKNENTTISIFNAVKKGL